MTMNFAAARQKMVDGQIRTNKVYDAGLLEAFLAVPREAFVPASQRSKAYVDQDIQIAPGRYAMQPMLLARLVGAAEPGPEDVAMVLCSGTGYSSAILARLVKLVVAVEADAAMARESESILASLSAKNIRVVVSDPESGDRRHGPYDIILADGGVADVPAGVFQQLAEGGRLVAVKMDRGVGEATLWRKTRAGISSRTLFEASVRLLPAFAPKPIFAF